MSCADEQALPWTPASMARPGPLPVGWRILKRSWRGCYERALVVVDGWLLTLEPASGRTTNTWPLADVLGVERRGAADVALRLAGPCGAAGWVRLLTVVAPSAAAAESLAAALSQHVTRQLPAEPAAAAASELSGSVLDARPCQLPRTRTHSISASAPGTPLIPRAAANRTPLAPVVPLPPAVPPLAPLPPSSVAHAAAGSSSARLPPSAASAVMVPKARLETDREERQGPQTRWHRDTRISPDMPQDARQSLRLARTLSTRSLP